MPKATNPKSTAPGPSAKQPAARKSVAKKGVAKKSAAKTSASKPARAAKVNSKPGTGAETANSEPYLRFYLARDLHNRLVSLLDQIEGSSDATIFRAKLSESIMELTSVGLDYYFVSTLKDARAGFVTQQSARLGLTGVQQVMTPIIGNLVARLDHAQLQAIAQSIRQFMK